MDQKQLKAALQKLRGEIIFLSNNILTENEKNEILKKIDAQDISSLNDLLEQIIKKNFGQKEEVLFKNLNQIKSDLQKLVGDQANVTILGDQASVALQQTQSQFKKSKPKEKDQSCWSSLFTCCFKGNKEEEKEPLLGNKNKKNPIN